MKQLLLPAFIVSLLAACNGHEQPKVAAAPVAPATDTVGVFILQDTSVAKSVELPAELIPYEQADLLARVQGYIQELKVDIGDKVRQGQVLAVISAPELQTRFAESESSLLASRSRYLSSADLYQRLYRASQARTAGIVAPVDLERSRNQMLADSASYQAAAKQSRAYSEVAGFRSIKAPFNGVVTARLADRGALVGAGQPVLSVSDNQRLRLRVAVPEMYTGAGKKQQEVVFRTDAYPEKTFTATLARKSGRIDASTRTELWEFASNNREGLLKPGAFAYVKLTIARQNASFVVPPAAVVTNQERRFVIRVSNSSADWVDVRQGMSTPRGIEIFGDVHNGDTLVARATDELKPATKAFWKVAR